MSEARKTTSVIVVCDCGKRLRVRSESRGKRVRCPHCQLSILAPITGFAPLLSDEAPLENPFDFGTKPIYRTRTIGATTRTQASWLTTMLSRFLFCVGAVTGVVGVKLYDAHTPLQLERPSYSDRDYVIKSSTYSMAMQDRIARTYHQSMLAGFFGGSCLGAVPYMCGIGYKSKSARNG